MAAAGHHWALMVIVVSCTLMVTNGQLDAIRNTVTCPTKIAECDSLKISTSSDKNVDNTRVTCCSIAAYRRCAEQKVAEFCPNTPLQGLINIQIDQRICEGYSFWTPECLYTNYMYEVIGAGAGAALIALILLCCCCYCCCCRNKK